MHTKSQRRRRYRRVMVVVTLLSVLACCGWALFHATDLLYSDRTSATVTAVDQVRVHRKGSGDTWDYDAVARTQDNREVRFTRSDPLSVGVTVEVRVRRGSDRVINEGFGMWIPSYLFGGWALLAGVLARKLR